VVRNVEFPCNLEVFGSLLGYGGGEIWAIVGLNEGWETKAGNNFLEQDGGNGEGLFT
jgi:hypothetical protein